MIRYLVRATFEIESDEPDILELNGTVRRSRDLAFRYTKAGLVIRLDENSPKKTSDIRVAHDGRIRYLAIRDRAKKQEW